MFLLGLYKFIALSEVSLHPDHFLLLVHLSFNAQTLNINHVTFSCFVTSSSLKVSLTDFHKGELSPCIFMDSSISSRKYC